MKETRKNLKIGQKILAKRSNAMWDALLARRGQSAIRQHFDYKDFPSSDGVYGDPKNEGYSTWGCPLPTRYYRGPAEWLLFEVWTG